MKINGLVWEIMKKGLIFSMATCIFWYEWSRYMPVPREDAFLAIPRIILVSGLSRWWDVLFALPAICLQLLNSELANRVIQYVADVRREKDRWLELPGGSLHMDNVDVFVFESDFRSGRILCIYVGFIASLLSGVIFGLVIVFTIALFFLFQIKRTEKDEVVVFISWSIQGVAFSTAFIYGFATGIIFIALASLIQMLAIKKEIRIWLKRWHE